MSRFIAYQITDPLYFSQNPTRFIKRLKLSKKSDMLSIRDKNNPKVKKIAKRAKNLKKAILIHQDLHLAKRLHLFGVHLTSSQLHLIKQAKRAKLFVVASTHTLEEIKAAKKADLVTYSPIFPSPNKPAPKGLKELRKVTKKYKNIIALGGIVSKREINKIKIKKAAGFASIRYFV